jgi:hypothetical protein
MQISRDKTSTSVVLVLGTITPILVEKDVDLALANSMGESRRHPLRQLRELHLVGPLGCDCTRYLLSGCDALRSLTLGVEWPDPAFCNVMPASRRDLLGREYLDEIRAVNSLAGLEEIHLFAQYSRGRFRLDKEFALYVLAEFKRLRHFGNFTFWKMTHADKQAVFNAAKKSNRDITFDEDFSENWALVGIPGNFRKNLKECYSQNACSWLPLRSPSRFFYFDEVMKLS